MRFTQASYLRSNTVSMVVMFVMFLNMLEFAHGRLNKHTLAYEVYRKLGKYTAELNAASDIADQLEQEPASTDMMDKSHLVQQVRERVNMTLPITDQLGQLYKAKFGDINTRIDSQSEFEPDDQAQAEQLLDKLVESHAWFGNFDWLLARRHELKEFYTRVEANEKRIQEVNQSISNSPEMVKQQSYLDNLNSQLGKMKQNLDNWKLTLAFQFGALKANVVKVRSSSLDSDYRTVKNALVALTEQCDKLNDKLDKLKKEQPLKQNSPVTDNSEEQEVKNATPFEGLEGSQENQGTPIVPPPGSLEPPKGNRSSQGNNLPFWKKRRFYVKVGIPVGLALFGGWLEDLHNKIPERMGWGSKEDKAYTKVNPPSSTTYSTTSTDALTDQVENYTVVIIVLVVLVVLVVGFAVFLVGCKNRTSDLEHGEASNKSQTTSTKTPTTKGTGASSTPTRGASSKTMPTSEVKSKKSRSRESTKTKSKRSGPK